MQKLLRILVPVGVLLLGLVGYSLLSVENAKEKRMRPKGQPLKTDVLKLQREDYQTVIYTHGIVRAHNEASLTAQVSGKVKKILPGLEDGSFFSQDEVLLEVDDEDFRTDVIAAEAQLARAEATHAQEKARAKQAKLNWQDLYGDSEKPNDLVLRVPQLKEAEANMKSAQAALERAKRTLERAKVRAPFAGRVLLRSVAIGQTISPGTNLATIFQTDFVEVRLPITSRQLGFLRLPERSGDPPISVELSDALEAESDAVWTAEIVGTEGALNEDSRELFAIARIDDPFSLKEKVENRKPPLRIGQPVRAAIDGKVLKNVLVIPRVAVHQLDRIFLVDEESNTDRRVVEPVWSTESCLIIDDATIPDGSLLALSRRAYSPNASKVEVLKVINQSDFDMEAGPATAKESETSGSKQEKVTNSSSKPKKT